MLGFTSLQPETLTMSVGCGRPLKPFVKAAAFGNALTAGLMGLAGQYFEAVEADKG
jgi:hypothetical protein